MVRASSGVDVGAHGCGNNRCVREKEEMDVALVVCSVNAYHCNISVISVVLSQVYHTQPTAFLNVSC